MKPALPDNEAERLNVLRHYQILDTPPEPAFDRIAEMAANFFQVAMAGVSLVDEDRVWFKSRVGINLPQTRATPGYVLRRCSHRGFFTCRMPLTTSAQLAIRWSTTSASDSTQVLPFAPSKV